MNTSKRALITGVGRATNIGFAIARELIADGWDLAVCYWHPYDDRIGLERADSDLPALVEYAAGHGRRILTFPADVAGAEVPGHVVRSASEALGPLTGLVLSHCESVDSGILDTTLESFERHFAVNARAAWLFIRAFAQQLPSGTADASIVALTSDHTAHNMPYGASKGAMDRIVIAAADELAHLGVRANVINPGATQTGWMDEATIATVMNLTPARRIGEPADTAHLTRFLMSSEGSWINAQVLYSNGGFLHGRSH